MTWRYENHNIRKYVKNLNVNKKKIIKMFITDAKDRLFTQLR